MKKNKSYWLWLSVFLINFLLLFIVAGIYAALPLDGSSGDSSSFTPEGFLVKRLIEVREGELQVNDIIISMDGVSIEELLHLSPFGRRRQKGEIVEYKVIRNEQPLSLQIQLEAVPFRAVISHWYLQLMTIVGLFIISAFLFWKRPHDQAVRWVIFFSTTISVQYWIDAYNFQPATLLFGWVFWFQMILEQFSYSLPFAALLLFVLAFLYPNKIIKRSPIVFPSIILFSGTIIKLAAMATAPTLSAAFALGNWISVIPAMAEQALAVGVAIYFLFTSQDRVTLAQIRIILLGTALPIIVTFIYSGSLALTGTPLISRQIGIFLVLLVPLSFTFAILRYQIFDIEIIIKQGLVYISLTLLLSIFFIFLVSLISFLTQTVFSGYHHYLLDIISALIIALLFNPLRLWVQAIIDHAFFRNKVDYNRLLPEMIAQLSRNIISEQLTHLLTIEFPRKLQISEASLQIFNTDEHREEISLIEKHKDLIGLKERNLSIPLSVGKDNAQKKISSRLVGLYNLGQKLSKTPYTREEINLLTTLGQQAAISIENARLYQEVENYNRTLEQKIQERTQELAKAKGIAENATSLLQTVMDNLDAFIYVSDIQTGKILFINQPMREEYGDIQGEICWQALYKNKLAPCDSCTNAILLTDSGTPTGAHREEFQDALTQRWYSVMSSAVQWVDRRMVRLATRIDITESKEIQKTLAESEERLSLAIDVSNSGLWDFNPYTFSNTHLSDKWFAMLGYGPNDLPHTTDTWAMLMHPDHSERVFREMQNHIERKSPFNTKFQMKTKDGGYRWVHSVGKVVEWDEEGHPKRMIGLHFDIDERIKAEEIIHKQEHGLVREKERHKLARDLHDSLTQSLHSLVLMADTSNRLLEKERYTDLPAPVQLLSVSARQALREMRLLLHELQLSEDAEINLQESLSTRLSIVENRVGIKTKLEIGGENHLSKDMRRELFYIATESLNNALKHANASQISISIQAASTSVEMLIKDNGRGFGTKPLNKGMGFENMQFRAEKLNGKLQVISSPRDGTKIRLKIAF